MLTIQITRANGEIKFISANDVDVSPMDEDNFDPSSPDLTLCFKRGDFETRMALHPSDNFRILNLEGIEVANARQMIALIDAKLNS